MMPRTALLLAALLAPFAAHAASWPARPLRLIIPFPAGSSTDAAARVLMPRLGEALGQQIVIDNRAGASGNIGVELGARAAPDGHTMVMCTASTHAVAPALNPKLPYDPVRDFAPVALLGSSPYVLTVYPGVAAQSVKELVALAKSRPGQLSYASAGNASLAHLAGELFSTLAGVSLTHVPYKSSALSVIDVMSGRVEIVFGSIAPTLPHIRSGRLRGLATTGRVRLPVLAELPTVIEAGLPGFEASLWMGFLLPARAPQPIVDRLNREMIALLESRDIREALIAQGLALAPGSPAAFGAHIRAEIEKWRGVAARAGIRPE